MTGPEAVGKRPTDVTGDASRRATLVRIAAVTVMAIGVYLVARRLHVAALAGDLTRWVQGLGPWGPIVYGLIYVAAVVALLPASAFTIGAGAIFGLVVGTIVVSLGSTTGAALAFLIARHFARDAVARGIARSPRFAAIDQAVGEGGWKIVALLRLSPAVPFNLQNYLYGLTKIGFWPCVLTSWASMLPGTIMYVYLGALGRASLDAASGARSRTPAEWVLFVIGLLATVAVTLYVTRLARRAMREHGMAGADSRPQTQGEAVVMEPTLTNGRLDDHLITPYDKYNRLLVENVHPPHWTNPVPSGRYNLVVVGAGTAGLVTAAGAAGLGAKVALIERHLMGGDCLNVGCVPSKALIRAARAAAQVREAGEFGIRGSQGATVDFPAVMARMRGLRAGLSPNDSAARFRKLGVDVFLGAGRFTGPATIDVDGQPIHFKKAVIATGGRASEPRIPGLEAAGYLTNETVFSLTELPRSLAVIGAGPIGCELAQAFARFGSEVVLIETTAGILGREDRDAAGLIERALRRDGIAVLCRRIVTSVRGEDGMKVLTLEHEGAKSELRVDEVLVGVGRAPNVEGLGLDQAGVASDRNGVIVDDRLRTSNPRIFAAGDVASRFKFTHAADALARIAIQNALFLGRARASALLIPWCTYTDPELAHVGLYEREASDQGIRVQTFLQELRDVDRAVLDGETEGFVKIHVRAGTDRILGATIVAKHAGEMISEITLAMTGGLGLKDLARTIHPYPTQAEALKKIGDAHARTRLTPHVKRLFHHWLAWTR